MLYQILIFAVMLITISWQSAGALTVAWVENGDLMVWHEGDTTPAKIASGDIQQAFIAPDGQHIAFTRGADHRSESLWAVNIDELSEDQLATPEVLAKNLIAQVGWRDASTVYFNTAQNTDVGQVLDDDLWRSGSSSRTIDWLSGHGDGGNFTFSPDSQHIVLVRPGDYDKYDGKITLVDTDGKNPQTMLGFPAISTGSEYRFYPSIFWEADSAFFRVAIPDKDLIYNDSTALTTLWRLRNDGSHENLGTVQASFFGQPQWSFDGQFIVYMRRVGDAADNQFELLTASGDGSESAVYTAGEAGTLQFIGWLPHSNKFLYAQGEQGSYWLGTPGEPPQALPGKLFAPHFVTDSLYIYIDLSVSPFELRYADLEHPDESMLVTTMDTPVPQFSAVYVP